MKKRVGIIFSGQMRSNSLNPNFTHDNIILESINKYFLNEEFKNKFDYDIFISTDTIDIDKSLDFFKDNLKNIHISETNWYMTPISSSINNYEYFYNNFLDKIKNYSRYNIYLHSLHQYYRMYCAYIMLKDYQSKTNTHYDYFVRIRPDIRIMQDLFPIFELLENSNKHIFIEHELLIIVKNELEDIFKLIENYGSYNQSIDIKKSIYLYLTAGGELYPNNVMCFCGEKQFVDHIYYTMLKQDLNYFDSFYGAKYPSFYLIYRTNLMYGYIPNEHPIYTNSDYIWKPIHDINYITHQFNSDLCKYKEQYPINPITVLFVNHKIKKCGVYQYGLRLYNILQKSKCINYVWCEIENYDEYMYQLSLYNYDVIFYNYHPHIMGWLNNSNIQKKIKNIGVQHDLDENEIFDITLRLDTTLIERENRYNIERPIFENVDDILKGHKVCSSSFNDFLNYNEGVDVPIFGSFGFCFNRKCFHKIVDIVCKNYDRAIIKLILTNADTIKSDDTVIENCYKSLTKSGVKLLITQEFVEENDILAFLNSNSMNVFLYESHANAGVSSVIDYALSVDTPLAICESSWFRHIYSNDICVDKTNIRDIMNNSSYTFNKFKNLFSNSRLIKNVNRIIIDNLI